MTLKEGVKVRLYTAKCKKDLVPLACVFDLLLGSGVFGETNGAIKGGKTEGCGRDG